MSSECLSSLDQADSQQINTLCKELDERMHSMREEQRSLAHLSTVTLPRRPHQAAQYRAMFEAVRTRYERLRTLVDRYCH